MSTVLVHSITVSFDKGSTLLLDPDHVAWMRVHKQRLTLGHGLSPAVQNFLPTLAERGAVRSVTFVYLASDGVDYTTTVSATEADEICYGWPGHWPGSAMERPGQVVPAPMLGGQFAVSAHQPVTPPHQSRDGEIGWHDPNCTWYYPR